MPQPSTGHQHPNIATDELQAQRERLRRALHNGASLEDAADLIHAMHALLPKAEENAIASPQGIAVVHFSYDQAA